MSYLDKEVVKESEVAAFLNGQFQKGKDFIIGYPVFKYKDRLVPIFVSRILHYDNQRGKRGFVIEDEVVINKEIINKYSVNEPDENLQELRDLEIELGFENGVYKHENLLGLVTLLQFRRPKWDWKDVLNPKNLPMAFCRLLMIMEF